MLDPDRARGALLGTAIGDALGMPVNGLSHQNVRLYYKGIKEYRADEKRGELDSGQWTAHTQRTFALARVLAASPGNVGVAVSAFYPVLAGTALRRATADPMARTSDAAACAAPLGILWAARDLSDGDALGWVTALARVVSHHPSSVAAAYGQAAAVRLALTREPMTFDGREMVETVAESVARAEKHLGADGRVSDRLRALAPHLGETPLDLQDRCDGTGNAPDEAFPFAVAMFARNPTLAEATLLSAVNVGGAAGAVGAIAGALLGAFNEGSAFPEPWRSDLEDADRLSADADAFVSAEAGRG